MLNNNFEIQEATLSDVDSLILLRAELLDNSNEVYSCNDDSDKKAWRLAYRSWIEEKLGHDNRVVIFIARDVSNGSIIGCITGIIDFRAPSTDCINGLSGWVQSMVVREIHRKQGVATCLFKYLLTWFNTNQVHKVSLQSTDGADVFYKKLGFEPYSENSYYLISD